ncbi:MAG: YciE/YciF ferroxidase family protein [Ilyomonas sp.]
MEKMQDLKDLLKHDIEDIYSAEEQILESMPKMIEKVQNESLKKILEDHAKVTEEHKSRLDKVKQLLSEQNEQAEENASQKKGFLSSLFGSTQKCKAMAGIIEEGEKVMGEDMDPEVMDAAIIACAQKIEHYEICSYGTLRAYATELNLNEIAGLLEQTLNEEYDADDKLTAIAVGKINEQAEGESARQRRQRLLPPSKSAKDSSTKKAAKKPVPKKAAKKAAPKKVAKKSSPKKAALKKAAPKKVAKKAAKKAAPKSAKAKQKR